MATVRYGAHLDMQFNELRKARFETVSTLPAAAAGNTGWIVRLLTDGRLYVSTGNAWEDLGGGATGAAFEHVQAIPQSVITVTHGLGFRPAVSMFAPDFGTQFAEFQVQHLDDNTTRVSMDAPQACVLVMS